MGDHLHYDADYFKWQGAIGEFGGWANLDKFSDHLREDLTIVDFGCGGGYLLNNIRCKEKIGIEVNETARKKASEFGIRCVAASKELPDAIADLVISNNALEHTTHPLDMLTDLRRILKPGGKAVFIVPCEGISWAYRPNDINYHLYCWSPMSIGNLFTEAGFRVVESLPYKHKWPPRYDAIARIFGRKIFNMACRIYARWETSWYQIRVVAEKPGATGI